MLRLKSSVSLVNHDTFLADRWNPTQGCDMVITFWCLARRLSVDGSFKEGHDLEFYDGEHARSLCGATRKSEMAILRIEGARTWKARLQRLFRSRHGKQCSLSKWFIIFALLFRFVHCSACVFTKIVINRTTCPNHHPRARPCDAFILFVTFGLLAQLPSCTFTSFYLTSTGHRRQL